MTDHRQAILMIPHAQRLNPSEMPMKTILMILVSAFVLIGCANANSGLQKSPCACNYTPIKAQTSTTT